MERISMLEERNRAVLKQDREMEQSTPLLKHAKLKSRYCFDSTRETIKYLTSKYSNLNQVAEKLGVKSRDKQMSGIDDEEKVFIESKIMVEEMRQNTSNLQDMIIMKEASIEVPLCDAGNIQMSERCRQEPQSHFKSSEHRQ